MSKKKGTLKIQKSQIPILVLNQSSNSTVFSIVRFPGGAKTVLSGDSLYYILDFKNLQITLVFGNLHHKIKNLGKVRS